MGPRRREHEPEKIQLADLLEEAGVLRPDRGPSARRLSLEDAVALLTPIAEKAP